MSTIYATRHEGDTIQIGDDVRVCLDQFRGNKARVRIDAPDHLTVSRPNGTIVAAPTPGLRMLSLWQPHATLFAGGVKKIETRCWASGMSGWLFVHAAKMANGRWGDGPNSRDIAWNHKDQFFNIGVDISNPDWFDLLPRGAIVGAVKVARCEPTEVLIDQNKVSDLEMGLGDYGVDRFGWVTSESRLFERPIPCTGGQRLRKLPDEVLQDCLVQLGTNPYATSK